MRADRAPRRGVADHQVIQPCIRHEIETPQNIGNMRQVVIDVLHQDGPVGFWQAAQAAGTERATLQVPFALLVFDQAGFHVFIGGQLGQPGVVHVFADIFQGATDEQGLFMPVLF